MPESYDPVRRKYKPAVPRDIRRVGPPKSSPRLKTVSWAGRMEIRHSRVYWDGVDIGCVEKQTQGKHWIARTQDATVKCASRMEALEWLMLKHSDASF